MHGLVRLQTRAPMANRDVFGAARARESSTARMVRLWPADDAQEIFKGLMLKLCNALKRLGPMKQPVEQARSKRYEVDRFHFRVALGLHLQGFKAATGRQTHRLASAMMERTSSSDATSSWLNF